MARQIVVDIIGDSKKFESSLDSAGKKAGGFGSVLKGVGAGIGFGAFTLLSGAVEGVVGSLGDASEAYKEDEASQARLGQALLNNIPGFDGNTDAIERNIAANMRLGFADEDQRDALGQLVGVTHDAGKAQDLLTLAMDLSAAKNISLAEATDVVTKASQGQGRGLKALGIDISGTTDAASLLDAAQKNVNGSAEKLANTESGKQTAANLKVGESMEKVGLVVTKVTSAVLPVFADALENVIGWLQEAWVAIEPVVQTLMKELQPAFKWVVDYVTKFAIPLWQKIAGIVFPALQRAVTAVAPVFRSVFGTIVSVVSGAVEGIRGAISTAKSIFNTVTTTIETVRTNVRTAFNGIVSFVTGLPARMSGALGRLFDPIWRGFKSAINNIIRGWNSLKFTIPGFDIGPVHFGGISVGTPNIPYLHAGGVVPGLPGADVAAILQAGEVVVPRKYAGQASGGITINIYGDVFGDGMDELARRLAFRLRTVGG